jgi:hypothetical protein
MTVTITVTVTTSTTSKYVAKENKEWEYREKGVRNRKEDKSRGVPLTVSSSYGKTTNRNFLCFCKGNYQKP